MSQSPRVAARRARAVDEIVATALEVMAEAGAAGLSLGEVAKRLGLRTPSLYGYFPSKAALCDELFARGWVGVREAVAPELGVRPREPLAAYVERVARAFVTWCLAHPAEAQLMLWRPLPAWSPSPDAYAHARDALDDVGGALGRARAAGLLRADADLAELTQVLTALVTGVVSQQLANEPGVPAAQGSFTRHLGRLARMVAAEYGVPVVPVVPRTEGAAP